MFNSSLKVLQGISMEDNKSNSIEESVITAGNNLEEKENRSHREVEKEIIKVLVSNKFHSALKNIKKR